MFYMIKSYEWLSKKIQTKASGYSSVGTVFAWHAQGTQFNPQHCIKPGMAGTPIISERREEAEESNIQSHLWLHSESEASPGFMRSGHENPPHQSNYTKITNKIYKLLNTYKRERKLLIIHNSIV